MKNNLKIKFYREEKFKETLIGKIPEEWGVVTLDKVSLKIKTGPFGSQLRKSELSESGVKVYTQENVLKKDFSLGNLYISVDRFKKLRSMEVKPGDILLTIRGSTGYSTVFPGNMEKGIIHTNLAYIRIKENIVSSHYLSILINDYNIVKSQIIALSSATTLGALYVKHIKRIKIPLPPLPEQKAIAYILSVVDNVIRKTDEIIEKAERLKKGLMQELLTRGIGHKEFKDAEIGKIPKEWKVVRLESIASIKGRIGWHGLKDEDYLTEGEYYLVRGIDFENGKVAWEKCVHVSKEWYEKDPYIQLKEEDILVTKDGTIGKVALIDTLPKKATLGTGIFRIRLKTDKCLSHYLYYIFKSVYFEKFIQILKAGSTLSHLYQKDLVKFKFPLSPPKEQRKIAEILSDVDKKLEVERKKRKKLERIEKALMDLLLTGKVRVKVIA